MTASATTETPPGDLFHRLDRLEDALRQLTAFVTDGQPGRLMRSVAASGAGSALLDTLDTIAAERDARSGDGSDPLDAFVALVSQKVAGRLNAAIAQAADDDETPPARKRARVS
jgi:hypothetical protein